MLGYDISGVDLSRYNPYIPEILPIREGAIIDQFLKCFQELSPEEREKKTQQYGCKGPCSIIQFSPSE